MRFLRAGELPFLSISRLETFDFSRAIVVVLQDRHSSEKRTGNLINNHHRTEQTANDQIGRGIR